VVSAPAIENEDTRSPSGIPLWMLLGLVGLLWSSLIVTTGATIYLSGLVGGWTAVMAAASLWAPFAMLSPLALWVARRFPLERPRVWSRLGIHLGVSLVFALAAEMASRGLMDLMEDSLRGSSPSAAPIVRPATSSNPATKKPLFEISEVTGLPRPTRQMSLVKAQLNVPIYAALLVVSEIFRAWARVRERERHAALLTAHLNEARLIGLRSQIQPHFLFNTLNSISVLMQRDPRKANEMLLSLSELLRMSLKDGASASIPLREELRLLRLYVGIQRIRFADRLRFQEEIDDSVLDEEVPTLLLQPLVENAIRHGIEGSDEPGWVRLCLLRVANGVEVLIENSCPTLVDPPGPDGNAGGIGLKNTKARLAAHFGDRHRFDAGRVDPGLFRVRIEFERVASVSAARRK